MLSVTFAKQNIAQNMVLVCYLQYVCAVLSTDDFEITFSSLQAKLQPSSSAAGAVIQFLLGFNNKLFPP